MQRFHIHRFELKYLLYPQTYRDIKRELLLHMDYDPYSLKVVDRAYFVSSVYYDTLHNDSYFDKIDGVSERKKIRLRTYSAEAKEKPCVYLEIKRKKSSVIIKDRAMITYGNYQDLVDNGITALLKDGSFPADQQKVIEEACFDVIKRKMSLQTLVTYRREAFYAQYFSNVRITLDREIAAYHADNLFPTDARGFDILPSPIILELKFSSSLPRWVHRIIQEYGLSRVTYSKYCSSYECLKQFEKHFLSKRRIACLAI